MTEPDDEPKLKDPLEDSDELELEPETEGMLDSWAQDEDTELSPTSLDDTGRVARPEIEEPKAKSEKAPENAPEEDSADLEKTLPPPSAEPKVAIKRAKPAPGEVLITANGLSKYYGPFRAVEDVSFEVRRGQVVAFLGPNGAGKSTTMKILAGMIAPDRGRAEIAGLDAIDDRIKIAAKLGYLPENGPLYNEMTAESLLSFLGEARGLSPERTVVRIAELKRRLHLETVMGKPIHKLSKGFRQRVGLAQALLHEPDVLILDEPTAGLDPNQIRDVRRVISDFGENKAVLLSTHILQEVEAIADRVIFIHKGRIVFMGSVEELRSRDGDLEKAFASHTGNTAASWARS